MEQQKKYFPGLDYLKVILAMLVVMRHACQYFLPTESIFYILNVNILSTCAVPCFFVISGYLFFSKENASIKKQCIRLFRLYLVWTLLYLPLNVSLILKQKLTVVEFIKNFLFSGSYYHLWFLPSLIVALFLNWLFRNRNIIFVCICFSFLFIIALLSEPYNFLLSEKINYLFKLYSSLFITFRNGLFFGSIYVFIGKVLSRKCNFEILGNKIVILLILSAILFFAEGILVKILTNYTVINILATCLFFSTFLFIVFLRKNIIGNISALCWRQLSTVIFCSHPIMISITSRLCKAMHLDSLGGAITISIFLICLVSYFVVYFSEKKYFKILKLIY